jgi:hypothetical protein
MKFLKFKLLLILFYFTFSIANSQNLKEIDKGITGGKPIFKIDSSIVFISPRPLLTLEESIQLITNGVGVNIIFSESGFGFGGFLKKYIKQDYSISLDLNFSESVNSDELPSPDYNYGQYLVAYKKNRLYNVPLMLGFQKYFFQNTLMESLKPFLVIGGGTTFVISTPYYKDGDPLQYKDFFSSLKDAKLYTKLGAYIGIGADFVKNHKSFYSFSLKYYYIPFGGDGIESMDQYQTTVKPITNFGGIQLNVAFGLKY